MPKLTKRLIEAIEPEDKDVLLRDSEIKGFLCKVTPKGKRVYLLYYRTKEGRERKPVIGEHGVVTCEQAREIAKDWLVAVRQGRDPSLERKEARTICTLAEFSKKYLRDHGKHKKPQSIIEDARLWRSYILPELGKHSINSVSREDVVRLHKALVDKPFTANRVLALLSKAFNLAIEWGDLKTGVNPAKNIKKYREHSRERFLSSIEIARLGEVLRQCELEGVELKSAILAIRLLIFTGCRRNEILELQWSWIDFEHNRIDFPDSKTGKKAVYLNPPTMELLQSADKINGNPYVCIGKEENSHLVNLQKPWSRIRRRAEIFRLIEMIAEYEEWSEAQIEQAKQESASDINANLRHYLAVCKEQNISIGNNSLDDIRLHDLRHSFASVGAAGGLSLLMIGKLLGHKEQNTTQRYAHLLGDPMKEATNLIGSRIAAALDGKQAEILPIRKT